MIGHRGGFPPNCLVQPIEGSAHAHRIDERRAWIVPLGPQGYHPVAQLLDEAETLRRLAHIRAAVANTVGQMPTQAEFLRQNGSAIDPAQRVAA